MPCANPINCPGVDRPVINTTAEAPDEIRVFGYGFWDDGTSRFCQSLTQELANICAAVDNPNDYTDLNNPPVPIIYKSNAQTCIFDCGGGESSTYTVVAGTFTALTQAAADALAYAFACQLAEQQCNGPVTVFQSGAQTCTVTCANGQQVSFTLEAGSFSGTNQGLADALAYQLACQVAAMLCPDFPPGPGGGPGGGSGNPPTPPVKPRFGNSPQICAAVCPGGGLMNYTVAAGTFIAESLAAANAIAASYACRQAALNSVCLGAISTAACVGDFYSQILAASGLSEPIVWSVLSGSLPAGIVLADDMLLGAPTTAGSSTFTLQVSGVSTATGENVISNRSFTIKVMEITTASPLPEGDVDAPYAEALAAAGNTGSLTWEIIAGALPDGLTLHPATGVISGTPTEDGDFAFTVGITDADGQECSKAFELAIQSVALSPLNWWPMEEVSGARVDVIGGLQLLENTIGTGAIGTGPGRIAMGAICSADTFGSANLSLPAPDPAFAYGGGGFEFCGWLRFDNFTNGDVVQFYYQGDTVANIVRLSAIVASSQWQLFCAGTTGGAEVFFQGGPINAGQLYFWRVFFDEASGKFGFQIDNGPVNLSVGTYTLAPQGTGDIVLLTVTSAPGEVLSAMWDEVARFEPNLTPEQLALIYNGGAGTTWPL